MNHHYGCHRKPEEYKFAKEVTCTSKIGSYLKKISKDENLTQA